MTFKMYRKMCHLLKRKITTDIFSEPGDDNPKEAKFG